MKIFYRLILASTVMVTLSACDPMIAKSLEQPNSIYGHEFYETQHFHRVDNKGVYYQPANYEWVTVYRNEIPVNAFIGGYEPDRQLYVCRAQYRGNYHPGKVVAGYCNITYGGVEYRMPIFQVLIGQGLTWIRDDAPMPMPGVIGGYENGHPLFVCQADYAGWSHPGKIVDDRCNIGYGGREVLINNFRVLVPLQYKLRKL